MLAICADEYASGDPMSGEPISGEPMSGEPISGEPISGEPMSGEPISGEPISGEPMSGEPMSGEPISGEPISGEPMSGAPTSCGSEAVNRCSSTGVRPACWALFISSAVWRMSLNIASVTSNVGSSTSADTCWPGKIGTRNQRDWPDLQIESVTWTPLGEEETANGVSQVRLLRSGVGQMLAVGA